MIVPVPGQKTKNAREGIETPIGCRARGQLQPRQKTKNAREGIETRMESRMAGRGLGWPGQKTKMPARALKQPQ